MRVNKLFVNRDAVGGFNESVEATALPFGTDEHAEVEAAFRGGAGGPDPAVARPPLSAVRTATPHRPH